MAIVIHKLNITAEASFDIHEIGLPHLDKRRLKAEVEEYIFRMNASGRLPWWGYFRCDYLCEDSGKMLKLFIYRRERLLVMQHWDLAGVCEAKDWSLEAEEDGLVRAWLQTKITDLPDIDDWAVSARVWQVLNDTAKTVFENVLKEVENEFVCKRDKEDAQKLAFLQSVFFEFRGRRRTKAKAGRDRKRDKRS